MRRILPLATVAAMVLAWTSWAATTPKKKALPKKGGTAPVSAAKKSAAGTKGTATRTASSRYSKKAPAPRTTWRNRQTTPAPERYKEIQDALVAKGYLRPEDATGAWGDASSDALKRFQADQKIDSSGKINSLSLIGLGLGPKHDDASMAVTKPPAQ